MSDVVITSVRLAAAPAALEPLHRFYAGCLGFTAEVGAGERLTLVVGGGRLEFAPGSDGGRPFYHFAFLVPGDRYAAARTWLERCAAPLGRPGQTSTTFRFDDWDADACYFHDPAGNIVELIAHRGIGAGRTAGGPFAAGELLGISELGLVVIDPAAAVHTLASAGIDLWSGGVAGDGALAFVGRQAHTLILCRPGRPWMPTQEPAESHPVTVRVTDAVTVELADGILSVAAA